MYKKLINKNKKLPIHYFEKKLINLIESYYAIMSLSENEIKEYTKTAIRDIFIQMPTRSVSLDNWNGFKNYLINFFGKNNYESAMHELQRDGWLKKEKDKYQWKKLYGPVVQKKDIKENYLNEQLDTNVFKKYIPSLIEFMINSGLKIKPLPKIIINSKDVKNSENVLGKTAYYDKNKKQITLFTLNRHPKDILRSLAHELIHHEQNLNNRLNIIDTEDVNEDDYLENIEREAYEKGNLLFRKWEDKIKRSDILYENKLFQYVPKIGDYVKVDKKFFNDNQYHYGTIVDISPNKQRLKIKSDKYPFLFWISLKNVTYVKN